MDEEDKSEDKYTTKIFRKVRNALPVKPKESEEEKVEAEPVTAEPMEIVEAEPIEAEPVQAEPVEPQVLGPPPPFGEKKGVFGQFPRLYWVVDTLEFFERGAFYGALAVMGAYVVRVLGIPDSVWGALYSLLYILLYFIPIISAAFAEKYGYKSVLISCLSLLTLGYLLVLFVGQGNLVLLTIAILTIGFGAGAFKPLVSATIAHITTEAKRNFAYSIYYWFINLGAFSMNVIWGVLFLIYGLTEEWFFLMFIVAFVLIIINIIISFLLFENPIEPQRDISIPDALKKIIPALKDKKFMILIVIYSGFWFIYAFNHTFLAIYMLDFRRMPGWFNVFLLAMINPGTIILVGPFLGKLVEKYKSLKVMMIGIAISLVGFFLVLFTNDSFTFIAGIIVFSVGEFITHPGFIAYVSKIAPKDRVAIYMGILFFPTLIGTVIGGVVHGLWYEIFVIGWHRPKIMGAGLAATGFLTIACLIIYNRWINRLAKEEDPKYVEDKSIWVKTSTIVVTLLFIPVIIGVGIIGGTNTFYRDVEVEEVGAINWAENYDVISGTQISLSGYANENSDTTEVIDISETNVISMNLTLTWTDEPDTQYLLRTYENEPDSFALRVETPDNRTLREGPELNAHGEQGEVRLTVPFNPDTDPYLNGTGSYNVIIECGECGDSFTQGLIGFTDSGNDWALTVDYEYYQKKEG